MRSSHHDILLESGTNEFEIIEFFLGGQSYGINVGKIREIVQYQAKSVTWVPEYHSSVLGVYSLRGNTFPLIDLCKHLNIPYANVNQERKIVLVCEFNNLVNGFIVDGVRRIHRCSWEQVKPVSNVFTQNKAMVTSSLSIEDREILILDVEHIIVDIYPDSNLRITEDHIPEKPHNLKREDVRVIFAEDSPIIREAIVKIFESVGYKKVLAFTNGKDAYDALMILEEKAKKDGVDIFKYVNVVVTDIEMPKMDGLTLCNKIKHESKIAKIPFIMFSSMINEQMAVKCRDVGANDYITKPQTDKLLELMDKHCNIG